MLRPEVSGNSPFGASYPEKVRVMSNLASLYTDYGQSAWLDYIDRQMLTDGRLTAMISAGLRGITSNPTIFHKAITTSSAYDKPLRDLLTAEPNISEQALVLRLMVEDIQMAADLFEPLFSSSDGQDGFVSLEVSPHLAYDTAATVAVGRELWATVQRPNVMIKVPATEEGLPAIEQLIADGINVNVTLLFSVTRYREVAEAYVRGLARNPSPGKVRSVASFFVSRVDNRVDPALRSLDRPDADELMGTIAVANAKVAYDMYRGFLQSPAFTSQRARGARPQRLLWGSTSTKNPAYSDVLYVEQLIGPDTVNTMPLETLVAFQDHGKLEATLPAGIDVARRRLEVLPTLGIDLGQIMKLLEREGVSQFVQSYDELVCDLREKCAEFALAFRARGGTNDPASAIRTT